MFTPDCGLEHYARGIIASACLGLAKGSCPRRERAEAKEHKGAQGADVKAKCPELEEPLVERLSAVLQYEGLKPRQSLAGAGDLVADKSKIARPNAQEHGSSRLEA